MKRRIKLIRNTILGLLLATVPFVTIAQERQGLHEGREMKRERHKGIEERISDLTDKQKESIKAIRLDKLKDVKDKRNILNEKNARLQTLRTSDEPDMKEIDQLVDEISQLKGDIAKREEKAIQEIRALLTEEQRLEFDMHMSKRRERARHKSHH
jgi:Spy/CpxP family protein refolding chaperone